MVWNIHFQVAAIIILLLIMYLSFGRKRLDFNAKRAFNRVLVCVMVSAVFDVASVVGINFTDRIGDFSTQLLCEFYLFSICLVGCNAAWLVVAETRYSFRKVWVDATALPLILEVGVLIVFKTGIFVDVPNKILYTYGITATVTEAICILYILSSLAVVIILRKQISVRRRVGVYVWMTSWLAAGLIQMIFPRLLFVTFAMALACVYMFCTLENPEYHIDNSTRVFNRKGFNLLVDEDIRYKRNKPCVNFYITNTRECNEIFGSKTVNKLLGKICDTILKIPDCYAFRLEDNLFSVVINSRDKLESTIEAVMVCFNDGIEVNGVQILASATVSYIEDISIFKDAEELSEIINFFANMGKKKNIDIINIDERRLKEREKTIEVQHALEWAIRNDAVEVYYQPIYDIASGKFSSMEALVRIRDEKGTLLFPNDFIEFAEKNGMILKLGEMIFRHVCEFIRRMHVEQYGIEFIDVNLSVVQCMQEDLAKVFTGIMAEYQIPPHRIVLEITETAAINSKKTLEVNMQELIDYGTSFSLDDYGSGYSNLTYIVGLPVRIIKIDRDITLGYFKSEKARIATESTIDMIHKLGMVIIVEGVETEEHYQAFKKLGVEYIQGYYFSKPIPGDKVLNFIQDWS